jgi:hypothetical protein
MKHKIAFILSLSFIVMSILYVLSPKEETLDITYEAFYIKVEPVVDAIKYQFYIEDTLYESASNTLDVSFLASGQYDITIHIVRDNKKTLKRETNIHIDHMPYYDVIETLYVLDDILYFEPRLGMTRFMIYMNGEIFETTEQSYDLTLFKGVLKHIEVKGLYENLEGRYSRALLILDEELETVEVEVDAFETGVFTYKARDIKRIDMSFREIDVSFDQEGMYIDYEKLKTLDTLNLFIKVEQSHSFYYVHVRIKDPLYSYLRSRSDILYNNEDIRLVFHSKNQLNLTFDGLTKGRDFEIVGNIVIIKKEYIDTYKTSDVLILSYVIREYNRVTIGYVFIR